MQYTYESSKLYWLKFIGQEYRPSPMECPKPLLVFLAGIFPKWVWYVLAVAALVLICVCLCKIAKYFTGSIVPGLVAAFLYFFANNVFGDPFLVVSIPYTLFPLMAITAYIYKKHTICGVLLLFAGLLRPEFWLLSATFVLSRVRQFKLRYVIPMLAPILWVLFDLCLSGGTDMMYSSHLTSNYAIVTGLFPIGINSYVHIMNAYLFKWYGGFVIVAGLVAGVVHIIGAVVHKFRGTSIENYYDINAIGALMALALTTILFYAIGAVDCRFFIYPRFFEPVALVLYLLLAMAIFRLNNKKIVLVVYLVLCITSINMENIEAIYKGRIEMEQRMRTLRQVEAYLDQCDLSARRVVTGDCMDFLSLRYGPEVSRNMVIVKEFRGKISEARSGDWFVWIIGETNFSGLAFEFLDRGTTQTFMGKTFELKYASDNGRGFVYEVK